MLKWATSFVGGGGPEINATILDPRSVENGYTEQSMWGCWVLLEGVKKEDGKTKVSIMKFTSRSGSDGVAELHAARNAVHRMKTLRHPDCLKYLDSCEVDDKKGTDSSISLFVVTEKVTTLEDTLRELQKDDNRNQYISMGLQQIARAVSFLNNDAKIVHGTICMSAIAVTESLDWKLHAFDVLSDFDSRESEVPMIPNYFLIPQHYKSVELGKLDWTTIRKSPPWAIDSWGLGCLIYEIFTFAKLQKLEDLRNVSAIPELLLSDYQKLLAGSAKRRLNPSKLLENDFFGGKVQDAILFLESLSLKDSSEKDIFFPKLARVVDQMPTNVSQRKVLPLLLNAIEYGGSPPSALGPLLKIGKQFSDEDFEEKVLPCITRLFASTDRALRIALLQSINILEPHLSSQLINEKLFAHIAAGFADSTAYLRELTLKCLMPLIPKFNNRNLNSELLKYLAKLQVDPEGVIRANTTICLGKIASSLSESSRKRVLLNAFTRAMKDQFPPARCAGLLATTATMKFYLPAELAMRAIPALSPSLCDVDSEVRQNAFRCMEAIISRLKEHSEELIKLSIANEETKSPVQKVITSENSGIMSWAVGSLSTRLGNLSVESKSPGGKVAQTNSESSETQSKTIREPASSSTEESRPTTISKSNSCSRFSNNSSEGWDNSSFKDNDNVHGNNIVEGWGDLDDEKDEWGDMEEKHDGWDDMDDSIGRNDAPLPSEISTQNVKPDTDSEFDSLQTGFQKQVANKIANQVPKSRPKSTVAKKPMKLGATKLAKPKLGATKIEDTNWD